MSTWRASATRKPLIVGATLLIMISAAIFITAVAAQNTSVSTKPSPRPFIASLPLEKQTYVAQDEATKSSKLLVSSPGIEQIP